MSVSGSVRFSSVIIPCVVKLAEFVVIVANLCKCRCQATSSKSIRTDHVDSRNAKFRSRIVTGASTLSGVDLLETQPTTINTGSNEQITTTYITFK
jgi:hypothetical protein